jgi:putative transposase
MYQSIWNWILQKYRPKKIFERKKKIEEFIIDETLIKIGSELIWLWVANYYRTYLRIRKSLELVEYQRERYASS